MIRKLVRYAITTFLMAGTEPAQAQPGDTIRITPQQLQSRYLRPGEHRYLVYFKMGPNATRTNVQFWTRTVTFEDYQGRGAVRIRQSWEDKDTIVHTVNSVCDRQTLSPFFQESWWKQRGASAFDYLARTAVVNGTALTDADTARSRKAAWKGFTTACEQYTLNWHLDLEMFPLLPFKKGKTFLINFYDPGFGAPGAVAYTVTGTAVLTGYDGQQIDCWLLRHEAKGNKELFWISKKTREVLKLEQEFNGSMYRYKIKLGFSM